MDSHVADRRRPSLRQSALDRLDLVTPLPSPQLHVTARLAAHIARQVGGEPLAAVHLLDDRYQHRVASAGGVPLVRVPVEDSMCVRVVESGAPVYTRDASQEELFRGSPFTSGPDPVRLYYSTPLRVSDGTVIGTLCVFGTAVGELDAAQRDRLDDLATQAGAHLEVAGLSRELVHLATHDPLTQVANRLLLSQRLAQALDDPRRLPHEPALLLVDLDDFKRVNDTHGHHVGDQVLASTAARLVEAVRAGDLVARVGGDEFAVLVEELPDPAVLEELAERAAAAVCVPHDTDAGPVRCGASIGAALGAPGDLAYELLGRADADMYARKALRGLPVQR